VLTAVRCCSDTLFATTCVLVRHMYHQSVYDTVFACHTECTIQHASHMWCTLSLHVQGLLAWLAEHSSTRVHYALCNACHTAQQCAQCTVCVMQLSSLIASNSTRHTAVRTSQQMLLESTALFTATHCALHTVLCAGYSTA
jgi:hypothetical protein